MSTKPETLNINSPYLKLIVPVFLIGGAWTRLEYKINSEFNQMKYELLKKIDDHIIADGFEKKAFDARLFELSEKIDRAAEYVDNNNPKEFIRPSETRMESKKRKQF